MRKFCFAIILMMQFVVTANCADTSDASRHVIWTIDFVKVKPGMFDRALRYFDAGWRPVREEAKAKGAIAGYHLVASEPATGQAWDILLITEYPDQAAYEARESLFGPLLKKLLPNGPPQIDGISKKDIYEIVESRVANETR